MSTAVDPATAQPADPAGVAFGTELLLDLADCDPLVIGHADALRHYVETLAKRIDMTLYGEPMIEHFGEGDLAGWTVIQLITTSNINIHACDTGPLKNTAFINVFSCKPFDTEAATVFTVEYFKAGRSRARAVHRIAPAVAGHNESSVQ